MFSAHAYWDGLAYVVIAATAAWLWSTFRKDVSVVDSLWSLMFLLLAGVYARHAPLLTMRAMLVLVLTALWAVRLSLYIAWRNWGEPEDRRYQAIRRRNEPHFAIKSLLIVFGLQALLAWIISLPLLAAISSPAPLGPWDGCGALLWLLGIIFEAGGDLQLARFKSDPAHHDQVMDKGLWRYTRHPNYFGDFCVWWGFYLLALSAGAWWSVVAPLLMSVLLMRVSGVTLLEKHIGKRRPAYDDYVRRTNAFFPGPRKIR
jgi:steroid 5-alpha reductase family enzyme